MPLRLSSILCKAGRDISPPLSDPAAITLVDPIHSDDPCIGQIACALAAVACNRTDHIELDPLVSTYNHPAYLGTLAARAFMPSLAPFLWGHADSSATEETDDAAFLQFVIRAVDNTRVALPYQPSPFEPQTTKKQSRSALHESAVHSLQIIDWYGPPSHSTIFSQHE